MKQITRKNQNLDVTIVIFARKRYEIMFVFVFENLKQYYLLALKSALRDLTSGSSRGSVICCSTLSASTWNSPQKL
eukprot:UN23154